MEPVDLGSLGCIELHRQPDLPLLRKMKEEDRCWKIVVGILQVEIRRRSRVNSVEEEVTDFKVVADVVVVPHGILTLDRLLLNVLDLKLVKAREDGHHVVGIRGAVGVHDRVKAVLLEVALQASSKFVDVVAFLVLLVVELEAGGSLLASLLQVNETAMGGRVLNGVPRVGAGPVAIWLAADRWFEAVS